MNINKYNSWAIVTYGCNDETIACSIIKLLKEKNIYVVVVDDRMSFVCKSDVNVYTSLNDVPRNIDIVVIVDKTNYLDTILDEMQLLDISDIWFEQGSYGEEIVKKMKENRFSYQYGYKICDEIRKMHMRKE